MCIVFDYIQKYPSRTKQILGISHEQFQALLESALKQDIKIQKEKETQKVRINYPGGGRKELLSNSEQICLCLFYLRQIHKKTENKILSSKRIFIEHLIRLMKIFQITSQKFRLNSNVY